MSKKNKKQPAPAKAAPVKPVAEGKPSAPKGTLAAAASSRDPVIMTELVLPSHTNALGTIFGGVVMSWIDVAGAIAAQKYARSYVVTVSVDYLHFIAPIKTGFTVSLEARVSYVGNTSMEVECIAFSENNITGDRRKATHAYLTYVAVDEFNRPRKVPPLIPANLEEKKLRQEAERRRSARLAYRESM